MSQLFRNNARSTLAASLATGGLSLEIESLDAAKFPSPTGGDFFDLTLQDATNIEVVRVAARSAGMFTLSARELEGTTSPVTFAVGTVVGIRLTAAVVESTLAHVSDTDAAHAASAISNTPAGNLVATTVQAALNELQTDVDTRATSAALTTATGANTTALNNHAAAADPHPAYALETAVPTLTFAAGTAMLFAQTAAPTGWTKSTTHNDKSLRVVNGTAGSGGSVAFSTAFASKAVAGSISNTTAGGVVYGTTLSIAQIPSHTHSYNAIGGSDGGHLGIAGQTIVGATTGATGSGGSHDHGFGGYSHGHTFTGTAINMAVQYVDVIIATKDA